MGKKKPKTKIQANPADRESTRSLAHGYCQAARPSASKFSKFTPLPDLSTAPLPAPSLQGPCPSFPWPVLEQTRAPVPGLKCDGTQSWGGKGALTSPPSRHDRGTPRRRLPPAVLELCPCWVPSAPTPETSLPCWHLPEPHASSSVSTQTCPAPKPSDVPGRIVPSHFCLARGRISGPSSVAHWAARGGLPGEI